jgi:nitroreductase/dihydropteridine reductase
MNLIEKLNWRYAAKRMTGQKIAPDKLTRILEAIRLSASSFGIQPYTILVIENKEIREKLKPAAYNQPQITEASHILVFAAWDNVTEERISAYINLIAEVRGLDVAMLKDFKDRMGGLLKRNAEENFNWTARQTYIALGTGLSAASMEDVDSTPMEGFDPKAFDEILGLKEKGLRSVAIMALGYRNTEADPLSKMKKVRRPLEQLFIQV